MNRVNKKVIYQKWIEKNIHKYSQTHTHTHTSQSQNIVEKKFSSSGILVGFVQLVATWSIVSFPFSSDIPATITITTKTSLLQHPQHQHQQKTTVASTINGILLKFSRVHFTLCLKPFVSLSLCLLFRDRNDIYPI